MFDLLRLTLDEAWAIHNYVRQHDKLCYEWDKEFMRRVHNAILDAQDNPAHDVSLMILNEDELWQIDRQVPDGLMVGTQPVGRKLLSKAMALIRNMDGGDDEYADTDASEDAASNHSRATTENGAGGSLPIST